MSTQKLLQPKTSQSNHTVCGRVLDRLDQEQVRPRSRIFFRSRECGLWLAWLVSVIVGAAAVAVTAYATISVHYALYEAVYDNFLTAFVDALPYFWLAIFAVVAAMAVYNVSHTRYGYRWRPVSLLGSSVVASVVIGMTLFAAGYGFLLDQNLGTWSPYYTSQEEMRLALWQMPEEGRMVGTMIVVDDESFNGDGPYLAFHDVEDTVWRVAIHELPERDMNLLLNEQYQQIQVFGTTTAEHTFHVCGVYPWLFSTYATIAKLNHEREAFLESVRAHYEIDEAVLIGVDATAGDRDAALSQGESDKHLSYHCAELAAIHRIRQ